jgi:hypothetical protein
MLAPIYNFIKRNLFKVSYEYFTPNINKIEIEITTSCNLYCINCDRSCFQAPSNESMSLEQIEKFISESIELNWTWECIRLIGGEPTLHPQLFDILDIVQKYKQLNPNCEIEVVSNGYGSNVNEVLSKLPNWVYVRKSSKTFRINKFYTVNIAPIDLKEYKDVDFTTGCWITKACGLGLSRYGYYPCGCGASCDRVFGFDIGLKSLSLLTEEALQNQLKHLCKYCGHYKTNNPINSRFKYFRVTKTKTSITWEKAFEKYQKSKPILSIYK